MRKLQILFGVMLRKTVVMFFRATIELKNWYSQHLTQLANKAYIRNFGENFGGVTWLLHAEFFRDLAKVFKSKKVA